MDLPHAIWASSSRIASGFSLAADGRTRLAQTIEDAGAAAMVLPSLFQEEIEAESGGLRSPDRSSRRQLAGRSQQFP